MLPIARLRLSLMTASLTIHADFFAPFCAACERSDSRLKQTVTIHRHDPREIAIPL